MSARLCAFGARIVLMAGLLPGCATLSPAPTPQGSVAVSPLRADLGARWIDAQGHVVWPPQDGFAGTPSPIALPVGLLLDRFGSPSGRFFSPRGAGYAGRALPYACARLPYTTYQVRRPIIAWVGRAAPWFDEPGGATQLETDATAAQMVGDGTLAPASKAPRLACPASK